MLSPNYGKICVDLFKKAYDVYCKSLYSIPWPFMLLLLLIVLLKSFSKRRTLSLRNDSQMCIPLTSLFMQYCIRNQIYFWEVLSGVVELQMEIFFEITVIFPAIFCFEHMYIAIPTINYSYSLREFNCLLSVHFCQNPTIKWTDILFPRVNR